MSYHFRNPRGERTIDARHDPEEPAPFQFLPAGGHLGTLIAGFDWGRTSVGPLPGWPSHMKAATSLMLSSKVPIVMLWGEPGVMVYNDAYAEFAGARHPKLLGSDVREGWPEVAAFNDNVMTVGLAGRTLSYRDQELTPLASPWPTRAGLDEPRLFAVVGRKGSTRRTVPTGTSAWPAIRFTVRHR